MAHATGICQRALHERDGDIYVVSLQRNVLSEGPGASSAKHRHDHPRSANLRSHFSAVSWAVVGPDAPQVRSAEDIPPARSDGGCMLLLLHLARVLRLQP